MPNTVLVAPSILAADFTELGVACDKVLSGGADWLHLDVMDGHFVPNISFGFPIIAALRKRLGPETFLDVHVMISDPVRYIGELSKAGASNVTFHVEAFTSEASLDAAITAFNSAGLKASLAFKPNTPIEGYLDLLRRRQSEIFMVLIMTVEPGFGGQKFMHACLEKVKTLRTEISWTGHIQVDGGLNNETAKIAISSGADVIVAGTAVFAADDVEAAVSALRV